MPGMATKKKSNTHTSTAKKRSASKRSASLASSKRAAKKTAKRSQAATKAKTKSKKSEKTPKPGKMSKKLEEMTLKMFQMVYDSYQKGKFHPIFHDYSTLLQHNDY
jgi:hypothetical protein